MRAEKGNYTLYGPGNTWGTNYTLVDEKENKEYLIDVMDVTCDEEKANEEFLLLYTDLLSLEDIETIKSYAWKVSDFEPIEFSRKFL